jgi:hypothetical protein
MTPSHPAEDPLGSSPYRESALGWTGNAPTLAPGPLAHLEDLRTLLTEWSPQL